MRFLFITAFMSLFLFLPILPGVDGGMTAALVDAKGLVPCGGTGESPCNACHAMALANELISFLFTILALLAVMVMMYAGVKLVISQGNSHEWEEAKGMLTNVIIGFVIVLSAWLIVDTIMKMLVDPNVIEVGMWNSFDSSECK
jgi:Na+-driven multidrug efflux pump